MTPRRQHRRFRFGHDDPSHEVRIEDLSLGGLRIVSNRGLRMGQKVEIEIPLGGEVLPVKARIVRGCLSSAQGQRYEYGARLVGLGKAQRQRLEVLISGLEVAESPIPEEPGIDDIEELRRRLSELQKEIARLEHQRSTAGEVRSRKGHPGSLEQMDLEVAFRTAFGSARFAHLVRLGQPLIKTSQSPADRLVGQRYALVAEAFKDSVDLKSLFGALRRELTEDAIVDTLFELYERKRIDFA